MDNERALLACQELVIGLNQELWYFSPQIQDFYPSPTIASNFVSLRYIFIGAY